MIENKNCQQKKKSFLDRKVASKKGKMGLIKKEGQG